MQYILGSTNQKKLWWHIPFCFETVLVYSGFSVMWWCSEMRMFLWVAKCLHVFTTVVILTPSAPLLSWWMWRAAGLMKSSTLWGPSSDIIKYAKLENMFSVDKMLVALQFCNLGMLFPLLHPYYLLMFGGVFVQQVMSGHVMSLFSRSSSFFCAVSAVSLLLLIKLPA